MKREYQICVRCIMDTSDSEISFNLTGECNHCTTAVEHINTLEEYKRVNKTYLSKLYKTIKANPGQDGFHAIIGVSGGVDSSFLLHLLSQEGLKLLAVHVDAGWNSIQAVRNINSLVSKLGVELETIVIDWEEMRELQLAYLKSGVINQDVPQDHAFFGSLFKLAKELGITYVISGSNYATESILPKSWGQNAMDGRQIMDINRKFGTKKLVHFPVTYLRELYWRTYITKQYQVVAPLNYIDYSKTDAIAILSEKYGWKDYGGKHKESRFTDFFQEIYLAMRFGIEKKRAHLSSLIVNGEISRLNAITILETSKPSDLEIENLTTYISSKIGINPASLKEYMSMPFMDDRIYRNEAYLNSILKFTMKVRNILRLIKGKAKSSNAF